MQLQAALGERGPSTILMTVLSIVAVIIAADYAHMIYLHFKMVRFVRNENFGVS
jgi:hypothetical protein